MRFRPCRQNQSCSIFIDDMGVADEEIFTLTFCIMIIQSIIAAIKPRFSIRNVEPRFCSRNEVSWCEKSLIRLFSVTLFNTDWNFVRFGLRHKSHGYNTLEFSFLKPYRVTWVKSMFCYYNSVAKWLKESAIVFEFNYTFPSYRLRLKKK